MFTPEKILRELEAKITNVTVPDPMQCDKWLASSSMQKAVRRGDIARALSAAVSLWQQDRQNFWRRLHVAAMEDCSADTSVVVDTLTATANSAWRRSVGDLETGLYLTQLLCESLKSRACDELLLTVERSSQYADLREQYAKADDAILSARLQNEDAPLVQRGLAAWYLAGYPSDILPPRNGNRETTKQVLRSLCAPTDLVESCIAVMNRSPWPMPVFMPLVWQEFRKQGDKLQTVESNIAFSPDVSGIPAYGCDMFTRIGQAAFRQLQKTVPQLKPFSVKQIGIGVFHIEGGILDRYITSQFFEELRHESEAADAEHVGLCIPSYLELRDLMIQHWHMLEDIRRRHLQEYVKERAVWGN